MRWEYRAVFVGYVEIKQPKRVGFKPLPAATDYPSSFTSDLNRLGQEGWELVNVVLYTQILMNQPIAFLKRPISVGAIPAAADDDEGPAVSVDQDTFDVILADAGNKKIQVTKVVHALTGLNLRESMALVSNVPKPVLEKVSKEDADRALAALGDVGATVFTSPSPIE